MTKEKLNEGEKLLSQIDSIDRIIGAINNECDILAIYYLSQDEQNELRGLVRDKLLKRCEELFSKFKEL